MEIKFNNVEKAIEDIKQGKMVIVVDDEDRENEEIWLWPLKWLHRKQLI